MTESNAQNAERNPLVENVECVTLSSGYVYTPESLRGTIESMRATHFDLPFDVRPVVDEAELSLASNLLSEEERFQLNNSPYTVEEGEHSDIRFRTMFDWCAQTIRAIQQNSDKVSRLRRRVFASSNEVNSTYAHLYNYHLSKERKDMGSNTAERDAWFAQKYPALFSIQTQFSDFLEEIDIELERLRDNARSLSRVLTASELSYQAQGKLYNVRG